MVGVTSATCSVSDVMAMIGGYFVGEEPVAVHGVRSIVYDIDASTQDMVVAGQMIKTIATGDD